MSRRDGILHAVVFAQVFALIEANGKPVEYREPESPVGRAALAGGHKYIRFQRGFHRVGPKVPTFLRKITHVDVGPAEPQWTLGVLKPGKEYVRIWFESYKPNTEGID